MIDRVFLTWTDHRRSRNLAPVFDAEYVCFESTLPYILRVLVLGMRTTLFLVRRRPQIVFSQNPSLALASLCCVLRSILGYTLVVDRHSNFKLDTLSSSEFKMRLFHLLSRWSIARTDVTIVTNDYLSALVDEWGGRGIVLPDKLPNLETQTFWTDDVDAPIVAVFVASYDNDEPLDELLAATKAVGDICHVYITGNYARAGVVPPSDLPNVTFTGFLSDYEYIALLQRVDLVIILTSEENLLNCGSYEAVVLGKPMMLSNSKAIREYFRKGAIYVDNTTEGIVDGFRTFATEREGLMHEVEELKEILEAEWQVKIEIVQSVIEAALDHLVPISSLANKGIKGRRTNGRKL